MFYKTLMALAATASLGLGAGAALSPAMANYSYCTENPSAVGCPGNFDVTNEAFYTPPTHKAAQHQPRPMARQHG